MEVFRQENEKLKDMQAMQVRVREGTPPKDIIIREGVLICKGRFLLSSDSQLKLELLKEFHEHHQLGTWE